MSSIIKKVSSLRGLNPDLPVEWPVSYPLDHQCLDEREGILGSTNFQDSLEAVWQPWRSILTSFNIIGKFSVELLEI